MQSAKGNYKLIENKGQFPNHIIARGSIPSGFFYLTTDGLYYQYYDNKAYYQTFHEGIPHDSLRFQTVKISFQGGKILSGVFKENVSKEYYNFFLGNDTSKWVSKAYAYGKITIKEIWKHIDMEIESHNDGFKFNFIVHRGGNSSHIQLKYEGQSDLYLDEGRLKFTTKLSEVLEDKPVAFLSGKTALQKKDISCSYTLKDNVIGFKHDEYPKTETLIIDPTVIFATFSGSNADNFGFTATYDYKGCGYAGGTAYAQGFPANSGLKTGFQTLFLGGKPLYQTDYGVDAAISKYSLDGKQLLWASYLGGKGNDQPHSMVVNKNNELVVFGSTYSTDFPASKTANSGESDIFITIISEDGTKIISSRLIGGEGLDGINGSNPYQRGKSGDLTTNYGDPFRGEVIVDSLDRIWIASCTRSKSFPTIKEWKNSLSGTQSACIVALDKNLDNMLFSTYLGEDGEQAAYGINFDKKGDLFICGGTSKSGVVPSSINNYEGDLEGFLAKVNGTNYSLEKFRYIGTSGKDQSYFVQVDKLGQVYVTGQTTGNFPVNQGVYSNVGGKQYIISFTNDLEKVLKSTVIGRGTDKVNFSPSAFLVDLCNRICLSGWGGDVNSRYNNQNGYVSGLPITSDGYQQSTDGSDFYLMVLSDNMDKLIYGSFLGGNRSHEHVDGGTSRFDVDGKVYQSVCGGCGGYSDFPITSGVWSERNNGVRPNDPDEGGCNNVLFKMDLNSSNYVPDANDSAKVIYALDGMTYKIEISDKDPLDSVTIKVNSRIFGTDSIKGAPATLMVNNGKGKAVATILWKPDCTQTDTYKVYISAKDNGCPTPRVRDFVFYIIVLAPPPPIPPPVFCIKRLDENKVSLSWDKLLINSNVRHYKLIKQYPNGNIDTLLRMVNNDKLSFVDEKAIAHRTTDYCYFIYGENICGVIGDSTYKICTIPNKDSIPDPVYLRNVTVIQDKKVEINWLPNLRDDFYGYQLYKKSNNENEFKPYKNFKNRFDTSFVDSMVNVHKEYYQYKVTTQTPCGVKSDYSNLGSSILLKGTSLPFQHILEWNDYKDWKENVSHYEVYRSDTQGIFHKIGRTIGNEQSYTDSQLNINQGYYYYYIIGIENENRNGRSVSNIIPLFQKPILYVPNAFTPNSDGINDSLNYLPAFVKDFHFKIFSRWGEFTWETKSKYERWDGRYRGNVPFMNVFIWQAELTGYDNSVHYYQGNFTILR